ncbi:ankyrin repeat-containing protein ITN1-like isoform X1 [Olea europaea var. sylvestris]|uniref:ankyrin repeat-containing protein ITN1-like isoform X1 n=1 Tax=Olea europaea var. sylvestris TaxID=158386 RepID=UPI000C1CD346|nr:ankyrin repeat-containing protein ITN1-like isoform X1 [Olea europaea var. sylvestris]
MAENKLYDAAVKGDVKSLLDLLKEDPLILDRVSFTCSDKTPLHIATIFQHTAFVQEILRRNPLLAAELDSHQSSSLHIASAKGYAEIVKAIVSAAPDMCLVRDCHGRNPLHLAAINGQVRVFNELIKTSSLAVREKADRGQTLLHLCVKHKQLQVMGIILWVINDYEFVNAKNDNGDTILHLAVRTKHIETVQYLMGTTGIDVNAKNANGYTALDILELTPTELRDTDNYLSIKNCLQPKAFDSINPRIQPIKWLTKKRDAVMVVAILIATMAFQAGVTPPGGVWQDDATDNSHKAGEAIMAHVHPKAYERFIRANTIAFVSSLSTILLLISGLPFRRRLFMWSLMVIMWLTVTSTAVTYAVSIDVFTPKKDKKSLGHVIQIGLIVWCSVMGILLVGNTVRLLDWWLQKRGITVWRPRRFRHLVEVSNQNVNQEDA